jgi:hypothetical protein
VKREDVEAKIESGDLVVVGETAEGQKVVAPAEWAARFVKCRPYSEVVRILQAKGWRVHLGDHGYPDGEDHINMDYPHKDLYCRAFQMAHCGFGRNAGVPADEADIPARPEDTAAA